jgi:hypothetical protein
MILFPTVKLAEEHITLQQVKNHTPWQGSREKCSPGGTCTTFSVCGTSLWFGRTNYFLWQCKCLIWTEIVCGHPFKWVVSATPVAYRCIKSSTQPCNLHKQTLAVEWFVLKSSVTFNVATSIDATFPTSQFKFCPAGVAWVNCNCCYCEVEMSRSNNGLAAKW